jgi:hypothetical protein
VARLLSKDGRSSWGQCKKNNGILNIPLKNTSLSSKCGIKDKDLRLNRTQVYCVCVCVCMWPDIDLEQKRTQEYPTHTHKHTHTHTHTQITRRLSRPADKSSNGRRPSTWKVS